MLIQSPELQTGSHMTVLKISYSYYRYDGAAPGGNGFCSNHHILPYHLMYLIGIICVALAKKKEESDKYSYYDKLLAQIKVDEKVAYQFPKNETRRDANGQIVNTNLYLGDVVGVLSWNQYNIFKGPRGLSRMDDPSQLGETVKPPSFPAKRAIDLKTPEAYRAIEMSTNAKDSLSTDLLFKCNDATAVESNVYFSAVKVDRGTGKLFAVKRSDEPTPEGSSREFEGPFTTY